MGWTHCNSSTQEAETGGLLQFQFLPKLHGKYEFIQSYTARVCINTHTHTHLWWSLIYKLGTIGFDIIIITICRSKIAAAPFLHTEPIIKWVQVTSQDITKQDSCSDNNPMWFKWLRVGARWLAYATLTFWTKERFTLEQEQSRQWEVLFGHTQSSMQFISGIFHLIVYDHGWPKISESKEMLPPELGQQLREEPESWYARAPYKTQEGWRAKRRACTLIQRAE